MLEIFIGTDSRWLIDPYYLLRESIIVNSKRIIDLRIQPLVLEAISQNFGFNRPWDSLQSTEFTYTRFLIPYLRNYKGVAIFMDNDMLCLDDIAELNELANDMGKYALRVAKNVHVPHTDKKMDGKTQTRYPRKNWSSLMIMNCEKLQLWTKDFVETATGAQLHRFEGIPDELIGDIPVEWNHLDRFNEYTKMIHYTSGGPWFKECIDHPFARIWLTAARLYKAILPSAYRNLPI